MRRMGNGNKKRRLRVFLHNHLCAHIQKSGRNHPLCTKSTPQQRPPRSSVVILLFPPSRSMFLTAKCVVLETIEFVCSAEEGRMPMQIIKSGQIYNHIINGSLV